MIYVDTSAAIKLLIEEDESAELERWLRAQQDDSLVTSDLTRIELVRSVIRRNPLAVPQALNLLGGFDLLEFEFFAPGDDRAPHELIDQNNHCNHRRQSPDDGSH